MRFRRSPRKRVRSGISDRLHIRFHSWLRSRLGIERKSPVKALGLAFHFLRYRTLLYLLKEVFVEEGYFFEADNQSPVILDCGSNIGASVLYFKRLYPQARVVAFEPFAPAFHTLRANVEANRLANVTLHNVVLAESPGEAELYFDPNHLGSLSMSVREGRIHGASQRVEAVRLSDYVDSPVDLLKMDIEGSEGAVLAELAESGKLKMIKQLIVEYHHHLQPADNSLAEFLHLLQRNGFGYRVKAHYDAMAPKDRFQDVLIHAYSLSADAGGGAVHPGLKDGRKDLA